jgi:hypothetical protein
MYVLCAHHHQKDDDPVQDFIFYCESPMNVSIEHYIRRCTNMNIYSISSYSPFGLSGIMNSERKADDVSSSVGFSAVLQLLAAAVYLASS